MFTVSHMHPTAKRLYAALEEYLGRKDVGSTLAAQTLGLATAQTMNNWEERGVSQAGIVKASTICRIRTAWIEREELPMFETINPYALEQSNTNEHHVVREKSATYFTPGVASALDTLEKALVILDMAGRERIAPMFESFARSPGAVIKNDIAALLHNPDNIKSHSGSEQAQIHKTG